MSNDSEVHAVVSEGNNIELKDRIVDDVFLSLQSLESYEKIVEGDKTVHRGTWVNGGDFEVSIHPEFYIQGSKSRMTVEATTPGHAVVYISRKA